MFYTYILKSTKQDGAIYIGSTEDLKLRLSQHNNPNSKAYSKRHAPWVIETYLSFTDIKQAKEFERYLKSNSGKAFMRKRLISDQFKEVLAKFNNGRVDKVSGT